MVVMSNYIIFNRISLGFNHFECYILCSSFFIIC